MNAPRVQPVYKRFRHCAMFMFLINHEYYELPKRTIKVDGKIYHKLKPDKLRHIQSSIKTKQVWMRHLMNLYYLIYTCWNEKYQFLTIDITK